MNTRECTRQPAGVARLRETTGAARNIWRDSPPTAANDNLPVAANDNTIIGEAA